MAKQQRPLLGFIYALITAISWGTLPIILKQIIQYMDVQTIVWYRFLIATVGVFIILAISKKLPKISAFSGKYFWFLLLGILGLASNFLLFNSSLKFIQPATIQVLAQLSPFMMMLFGVIIFKEAFGLHHKIGLLFLIIGLILFFNDRFSAFSTFNQYSWGILLGIGGSIIWVFYGISQKLMLTQFSSAQILLVIYCGCTFVLSPLAEPSQIATLNTFTLICLLFCCINTLIGYGAYAEALNHWDVSKVSIIVTLVPLFTILFSDIFHLIAPQHFEMAKLNTISYLGAFLVVFGAITAAVGHKLIYRNLFRKKTA